MEHCPRKTQGQATSPPKMKVEDNALAKSVGADQEGTWLERLAEAFGVRDTDAVTTLLSEFISANCKATAENCLSINSLIANLAQLRPEDPVESMLAMQMISCHRKAMKMLEQATKSGTSINDSWTRSLNLADKLMRTYTRQVEILAQYRRGGQQKVRVEHVTVKEGGQAILGDVNRGGRE